MSKVNLNVPKIKNCRRYPINILYFLIDSYKNIKETEKNTVRNSSTNYGQYYNIIQKKEKSS